MFHQRIEKKVRSHLIKLCVSPCASKGHKLAQRPCFPTDRKAGLVFFGWIFCTLIRAHHPCSPLMTTFAPPQCLSEYIHEYRLALAFALGAAVAAIGCSSLQLDGGQNLFSSAKTLFPDDIVLFEWKTKGYSSNEESKSKPASVWPWREKKHEKVCRCGSLSVCLDCGVHAQKKSVCQMKIN